MDQAYQLRKIVAMLKESREFKEKNKTRIVAVTSGKGGVGKTTFSVNFALSLSKKGFRVLIIDGDFGLSNVNIVMGVPIKYDLSHVLTNEKTIDEVIVEGPGGIKFISGGHGFNTIFDLSTEQLESYLEKIKHLENMADIIIIDTGAGITENILKMLFAADEIILVTTPEATALMDAYAMAKTLANTSENVNIRLVVNMAQSYSEAINTMANFKTLSASYLNTTIEGLGYILSDKAINEAIRFQKPFIECFPKSGAAKDMEKIVSKFINSPCEIKKETGFTGFFRKMFKKTVDF